VLPSTGVLFFNVGTVAKNRWYGPSLIKRAADQARGVKCALSDAPYVLMFAACLLSSSAQAVSSRTLAVIRRQTTTAAQPSLYLILLKHETGMRQTDGWYLELSASASRVTQTAAFDQMFVVT